MSRKYEVKRGDKIRINAYYAPTEKELKEAYKKRKGLKIARGFSDSPEARKLRQKKNRALRRAEVKLEAIKVVQQTIKNPEAKTKKGQPIDWEEVDLPDGITITPVNEGEEPNPFYLDLSFGSGTDEEVISQWKIAQRAGYKVTGVISNTFTGDISYSYDLYTFKKRIKALYMFLKEKQKELNVDLGLSSSSEEETIIVPADPNKKPPPPAPSSSTKYPLISTNLVTDEVKKTLKIVVEAHG